MPALEGAPRQTHRRQSNRANTRRKCVRAALRATRGNLSPPPRLTGSGNKRRGDRRSFISDECRETWCDREGSDSWRREIFQRSGRQEEVEQSSTLNEPRGGTVGDTSSFEEITGNNSNTATFSTIWGYSVITGYGSCASSTPTKSPLV